MVDYSSVDALKEAGYEGFCSAKRLRSTALVEVPNEPGVYFVLAPKRPRTPDYLEIGTGGYFKGKDPNVSIAVLRRNWVPDALVLYIGKAGGPNSGATLRRRLGQYLKFGEGKAVGHRGGRYIWQIRVPGDLTFCWRKTSGEEEPRLVEKSLIVGFREVYGARPFANLRD